MAQLSTQRNTGQSPAKEASGAAVAAAAEPQSQETAEITQSIEPAKLPSAFNADVPQSERIRRAEQGKQESEVFAETRERAENIVNREQSSINMAESTRRESGLFGSFHRALTLSDPYQIEINNSSQTISTTKFAQRMVNDAQKEADPTKRAELLNQARRLLGLREVGSDFVVSDDAPVSSGVNRVSTDQSHFALEQESINVSRDVAITAAVTVGTLGGGAVGGLMARGGQVAVGSVVAGSTTRVVGQGMVMGAVEGSLEASARAVDDVQSGQRTQQEAAWDITRDTALGAGLGGALGGAFRLGAKQFQKIFGAGNATDDGLKVDGDEIDQILNSPSIEGTRNARMQEPGLQEPGFQEPGSWVDSAPADGQLDSEAALVGAPAGHGPQHLAAAADGPSYNPGTLGSDLAEGPTMSGNRGRGNGNSSVVASGGGDVANIDIRGRRDPVPYSRRNRGTGGGLSEDDIKEMTEWMDADRLTREDILEVSAGLSSQQLESLPSRIRNRIEAVRITSRVESSLNSSIDPDQLAANLEKLARDGLKMPQLERILSPDSNTGAKYLEDLTTLQARGVRQLAPLLELKPSNTHIVAQLLKHETALAIATQPNGVSKLIRKVEIHEAVKTLNLSPEQVRQVSDVFDALLQDPAIAARVDSAALASTIRQGGDAAIGSLLHSAELIKDGFSKYVAKTLERAGKETTPKERAFLHADIARTVSLSRRSLAIDAPPLPAGQTRNVGQALELGWQQSAQGLGRFAFTANDAIEYFAKKNDLRLPEGEEIIGLEGGVDIAFAQTDGIVRAEDFRFAQIKNSPGHALTFYNERQGALTPLLIGPPSPGQSVSDFDTTLHNLRQSLRHPLSFTEENAASVELTSRLSQDISSGRPQQTEPPLWFRAYVQNDPAAIRKFAAKIESNLRP